jgi:histone H3/H4
MDPNQKKNKELVDKFWEEQFKELRETDDFKPLIPISEVKEIMEEEADVKIANETCVFMAKACELFIKELTMRSMLKMKDAGRTTIEINDVVDSFGDIESETKMQDDKTQVSPNEDD